MDKTELCICGHSIPSHPELGKCTDKEGCRCELYFPDQPPPDSAQVEEWEELEKVIVDGLNKSIEEDGQPIFHIYYLSQVAKEKFNTIIQKAIEEAVREERIKLLDRIVCRLDDELGGVMDSECEHGFNPAWDCPNDKCQLRMFWAAREVILRDLPENPIT